MNVGEMERAKRRALNILDEWLEVSGFIPRGAAHAYRDELEGVVEDAVQIGAQAALGVYEAVDSEKS